MTKAIVFTHINERNPENLDLAQFIDVWSERFEGYVRCTNVSIVFAYVSYGLEKLFDPFASSGSDKDVTVALSVLAHEGRLLNALEQALQVAHKRTGCTGPKFVFIGTPQMAGLLKHLRDVSIDLLSQLAQGARNMTYDAPKFVEAVIRLRRQSDRDPDGPVVLRFDADVKVDMQSIEVLLQHVHQARASLHTREYYIFSGAYSGRDQDDVNNIYPVRLNWFLDNQGGLTGDYRQFLRDMGEIGATQIPGDVVPMSSAIPFSKSRSRERPQPISGAGLVMSDKAIRVLPPFMNLTSKIVWVDDHLKRTLHEQIGHMSPTLTERVDHATFQQCRHDMPKDYLERLARGCLMHALVNDAPREAGPLAVWLKALLGPNAGGGIPDPTPFKSKMTQRLEERAQLLKELWTSNLYGSTRLRDEARDLNWERLRKEALEDAVRYSELVASWPLFVSSIEKIRDVEIGWLWPE